MGQRPGHAGGWNIKTSRWLDCSVEELKALSSDAIRPSIGIGSLIAALPPAR